MKVYTAVPSGSIPKLYQSPNDPGSTFSHGRSFKNEAGHDANCKVLRRRHRKNQQYVQYNLSGTIYVCADLTQPQVRRTWRKISKALSAEGVVLWWFREITRRTNRVHYHVITTSKHTEQEVKTIVRDACPYKCRLMFKPETPGKWANYSLKLTTGKNGHKIVLFAKTCSLRVHGDIGDGDFWQYKPKKKTAAEKQREREEQHKLREARNDDAVYDQASALADALGLSNTPSIPEYGTHTYYPPQAERTVVLHGVDLGSELQQVIQTPSKPPDYRYINASRRDILDAYARNLVTDPSLYATYGGTGSFRFSPCPQPPKPPVRRKKQAKPAYVPFDPANCDSFTI